MAKKPLNGWDIYAVNLVRKVRFVVVLLLVVWVATVAYQHRLDRHFQEDLVSWW